MASSTPFVLGGFCPIDKDSSHAQNGQFGVVTSLTRDNNGLTASITLFDERATAEAVAAHLSGISGASPLDPAHATALANAPEVKDASRRAATRFTTAGKWQGFFEAYKPPPSGQNPRHDASGMLGTTQDVSGVPIIDNGVFRGSFTGQVTVTVVNGDDCTITFDKNGASHTVTMAISALKVAVQAAQPQQQQQQQQQQLPPPPAAIPLDWDTDLHGQPLFRLLHALPQSRNLTAQQVCAIESLAVAATALGSSVVTVTDAQQATSSHALSSYLTRLSMLVGDAAGTWPDASAERLGAEIKRRAAAHRSTTGSAPPPSAPSTFPRGEALRKLARDSAAWDSFLKQSVAVTTDNDRHGNLASGSEYIRCGALEAYLKRGGQNGTESAIASLSANKSSDELLHLIMFVIVPSSSQQQDSAANSSAHHSAQPHGMTFHFSPPDQNASYEERTQRLTLRGDADAVMRDAALLGKLDSMHAHIAPEDQATLAQELREVGSDSLRRLVSNELDIDKALQGAYRPPQIATRSSTAIRARAQPYSVSIHSLPQPTPAYHSLPQPTDPPPSHSNGTTPGRVAHRPHGQVTSQQAHYRPYGPVTSPYGLNRDQTPPARVGHIPPSTGWSQIAQSAHALKPLGTSTRM